MAAWSLANALGRAGIRLAAAAVLVLVSASCASTFMGAPAAWADGEVRDIESFRPIPGAVVRIADPGDPGGSGAADRTNAAGRFSVFQTVPAGSRKIPLLVVADGFKPAEFPLTALQSNTLMVRLAPENSPLQSRIEYMAPMPGDGSGSDGDCGSH